MPHPIQHKLAEKLTEPRRGDCRRRALLFPLVLLLGGVGAAFGQPLLVDGRYGRVLTGETRLDGPGGELWNEIWSPQLAWPGAGCCRDLGSGGPNIG